MCIWILHNCKRYRIVNYWWGLDDFRYSIITRSSEFFHRWLAGEFFCLYNLTSFMDLIHCYNRWISTLSIWWNFLMFSIELVFDILSDKFTWSDIVKKKAECLQFSTFSVIKHLTEQTYDVATSRIDAFIQKLY